MRSSLLARRLLLLCTASSAPPHLLHTPALPLPYFRSLMATATAPAPTTTAVASAPAGADARKVRGRRALEARLSTQRPAQTYNAPDRWLGPTNRARTWARARQKKSADRLAARNSCLLTLPSLSPLHQAFLAVYEKLRDELAEASLLGDQPALAKAYVKEVREETDRALSGRSPLSSMPSPALSVHSQMLDFNVPGGKLNRGMAVADALAAHKQVPGGAAGLPPADKFAADALGWCIEWLQAFFLVADDIMDNSVTRRGAPCWYRMPHVSFWRGNIYGVRACVRVLAALSIHPSSTHSCLMSHFSLFLLGRHGRVQRLHHPGHHDLPHPAGEKER